MAEMAVVEGGRVSLDARVGLVLLLLLLTGACLGGTESEARAARAFDIRILSKRRSMRSHTSHGSGRSSLPATLRIEGRAVHS